MSHSITRRTAAVLLASAGLAATASGCGSTSHAASASTSPAALPTVATTTTRAQVRRLRIVSPRRGAHTGQAVTVRVALSGGASRGARFRYRVDHGRTRQSSDRLVLRGLPPGRHALVVTLAGDGSVRASTQFVVKPPSSTPSQSQTQTSIHTIATSTSSAPVQTTSAPPPPPPTTTATQTAPAPNTTHTTSAGGGIPQGGGGDGDADNSGGPSDGDGNV